MLVDVWFCVMMQAFVPGGDRVASMQTAGIEAQLRAELESSTPLIGAAGHIARYTPLTARAR